VNEQGSITQWIAELKEGDQDAAREIWERYLSRLIALARKHLRDSPRRMADEEDVVISVFDKFSRAARDGSFKKLDDREDLWQILVLLTTHKAINQRKHDARQKRGGGKVRGESVFQNAASDNSPFGLGQVVSGEPTPEFAAEVAESCREMLDRLPDETMRGVALARMEGHSNKEIASLLQCTERTVERKLSRIRKIWETELPMES